MESLFLSFYDSFPRHLRSGLDGNQTFNALWRWFCFFLFSSHSFSLSFSNTDHRAVASSILAFSILPPVILTSYHPHGPCSSSQSFWRKFVPFVHKTVCLCTKKRSEKRRRKYLMIDKLIQLQCVVVNYFIGTAMRRIRNRTWCEEKNYQKWAVVQMIMLILMVIII